MICLRQPLRQLHQEETAMADDPTGTKAGAKKTRARVREAVQEGTEQATQTAEKVLPDVSELVSKTLYGACYYGAFGVTFAALTIAKLIPTDSSVARGLHDGTEAAAKQIEARAEQEARMAGESTGPIRAEGEAPA
jgi:predicted S18 family serine protease